MIMRDSQRRLTDGAVRETFVFADLCGFTEYTCHYGDKRAADLAVGFHRRVRELAADEGCNVIKSIGDAVMIHSHDCRTAVRLACRILGLSKLDGYPPIRIGIDSGPAVRREGDWYGSTVNAAARVADVAAAGEVLMTERVRSAVDDGVSLKLEARGTRELKGLPAAAVHAAVSA
jgi:class 3 adenylate cyclase